MAWSIDPEIQKYLVKEFETLQLLYPQKTKIKEIEHRVDEAIQQVIENIDDKHGIWPADVVDFWIDILLDQLGNGKPLKSKKLFKTLINLSGYYNY